MRPNSNITTQMRVYAKNEEEARENVALNGWQIISVARMDQTEETVTRGSLALPPVKETKQALPPVDNSEPSADHIVKIVKTGDGGDVAPLGTFKVKDGGSVSMRLKPSPCETLQKVVVNGNITDVTDPFVIKNVKEDTFVTAVFKKNGSQCDENGVKDDDLKEIAVIYFKTGYYNTKIPNAKMKLLRSLSKDKKYIIVGHSDDVHVVPNKKYKDNYQLSSKRAKFVLSKLPDGLNVKIMSMGPAYPVAPNSKDGQPLNRRAVVYERR